METHVSQPDFETSLVYQIGRRTIMRDPPHGSTIASVFMRPGIPGWIFVEGNLPDVMVAIKGLVTVFHAPAQLVPPEECTTLLAHRITSPRPMQEGDWVCCKHGLYVNDVGIVCGCNPSSDAKVIIAFVPKIPNKVSMSRTSARRAQV